MEKSEKKKNLEAIISSAGKAAKDLLDNTIQVVDQNDDGKFDLTDVSAIAGSMSSVIKKGAQTLSESTEETARKLELKALRPIFKADLDDAEFLMPKFIRVVERDKRRAESEVCKDSIGYMASIKGIDVIHVFSDSAEAFGISLIPDSGSEFYYMDPSKRDGYIALDEYFGYLKLKRVNELQRIAQDLGAKYFKVTYKEEQASFSEKKVKGHIKTAVTVDAEHASTEKKYSTIEIAAVMSFPGHDPVKPQLRYLQKDPTIQNLIEMRMNTNGPLLDQKLTLKLSNTSGMKEKDAAKIDTILKGLKCSGNTTVESEAKNESRRLLEYEIRF